MKSYAAMEKGIAITLSRIEECERHLGIINHERKSKDSVLHDMGNRGCVEEFLSDANSDCQKIRMIALDFGPSNEKDFAAQISKIFK